MLKATDDFFNNIRTGNFVEVWWDSSKLYPWDGYGRRGRVIQVTRSFVTVRSPAGFPFCVGRHHIATGAKIKLLNGGEAQCSGSPSRFLRAAKAK
ncbi:MAG: hypothetical protein C4570_04655 [Ammonifex sp.]|jgi:hypothetical protein|nr:MAG: hypothetical protein C4570_04655 [Ammonifex sp.]